MLFLFRKEINHMEIYTNCAFSRMYRLFSAFSSKLSDDNTKEARARWNAPSHEVSHSAMLLREHTLPDINYLTRPLWSHIQQRLLLHRLSIHIGSNLSRCDNNREEINHVQAKSRSHRADSFFVMLLFFFLR